MKVSHLETTVLGTKRLNGLGTSWLNCLGTKRFSWVRNDRRCETTGNLTINLMYQKLILLYNCNFFLNSGHYHWLLWGNITSNNKTVVCVKFLIWVDNITKSLISVGSNGTFPARVYERPLLHVNMAWLRVTLNRHDIMVLWYFALLHTLKEVIKMFDLFLHRLL